MEIFSRSTELRNKTVAIDSVVMPVFGAALSASVIDGGQGSAWGIGVSQQGSTLPNGRAAKVRNRTFGPNTVFTGGAKAGANGISVSGAGATAVGYNAAVPNPATVDRNGNTRGIPPRIGPPILS